MKKLVSYILIPLLVVNLSSCKKFVEGYDVSPNQPSVVTPALLLTAGEVATISTYSSGIPRAVGSWVQQLNGCQFQSQAYSDYNLFENDVDNDWTTIYSNAMQSFQTIITDPTYSTGNPHYVGIAKVLKAVNLGVATDLWGDIPNKEALRGLEGEDYFKPNYDKQADVIADIQALLSSAITDLSQPASANKLLPSYDDVIYGGDVAMWTKAAYALKARYAMRLSKKDATTASTDALAAVTNAFASSSEDMFATFDPSSGPNQWNAFEAARAGYVRVNAQFVTMLQGDPRLSFYLAPDANGTYTGAATGTSVTDASYVGSYLAGSASTPIPMVTYVEMKFIEAEAKFRKADLPGAAAAYNAAVLASVKQVTGANAPTAWSDVNAAETDATISLTKIMTAKYTALFGQIEVYNDWRRTNIPALTPNPNGAITSIPRRYPTPLNERANNTNAPAVQDLTQKVWWDQ